MPRNSQAEGPSLLVAAISARALAQAARRAGYVPLVADFFADTDTQQAAHACRKLGAIARGMRKRPVFKALEALEALAPSPVLGLVYGAGFEQHPALLHALAGRWPLLGNDGATVARLKSPETFFGALDGLGVPHPETTYEWPAKGAGWLAKTRGGAGGSHIVPSRLARRAPHVYFQEQVDGRAVSALFVGNGRAARVLGFSEQWTAPKPPRLWRYGGAVRPATLAPRLVRQMTAAVLSVARHFAIKGLASADFLLDGETPRLLEINPRPGATLDIFDCAGTPLLGLHVKAVTEGKLPGRGLKFEDAMASAIVYADAGGATPSATVWPAWAKDRPKSAEWIDKNRPICTVVARAPTASRAKRLIKERICKIQSMYQTVTRGEDGEQEGRNRRSAPAGAAERQRQGRAARQSSHR